MKSNEGALRPRMAAALLLVLFKKIRGWDHNPKQLNSQQRGQHCRLGKAHGARDDLVEASCVSFASVQARTILLWRLFQLLSIKTSLKSAEFRYRQVNISKQWIFIQKTRLPQNANNTRIASLKSLEKPRKSKNSDFRGTNLAVFQKVYFETGLFYIFTLDTFGVFQLSLRD